MRSQGRILFSFLFLFAFLVPTVGETLHQLSHAGDSHCTEKSVHHFHEEEHHCVICDFSFNSFYSDILIPEIKATQFYILQYKYEVAQNLFIEEVSILALRGPPVS
mgnify:CR=1 FL=1